jgi:glycosyltransferase involved in cell wall biosynthesis
MLCECVPVVSRRAALPEVVGDCGVYVDNLTPEALANGILQALTFGPEWGKRARQRVVELFPLEKRRAGLLAAINEVMAT